MIKQCQFHDIENIYTVINDAAKAYEGVIPPDCYHEPYMSIDELSREMQQMSFFGWQDEGQLVGVMGFQRVKDVTLIRHAYVATSRQNQGIGSQLLKYLKGLCETRRLLVGTWADARWAITFYEKRGFCLLPDKDRLLRTYWRIPDRQVEVSVVLGLDLP
ncbi:MAG: GNAT family N-acetyltransferase [Chloroflexi bacterium]|nr:GNAT family N-acetyltransferase [Chloroflexota bacterium]MBM3174391.1 GNAT family N-acetyltransferase [Chloroflexota bacterium]